MAEMVRAGADLAQKKGRQNNTFAQKGWGGKTTRLASKIFQKGAAMPPMPPLYQLLGQSIKAVKLGKLKIPEILVLHNMT